MSTTGFYNSTSFLPPEDKKREVSTVILSIIGMAGLMVIVSRLLYRYADLRKTPWYALATTWLNWFAAVALVLLIPVDVSTSIHQECLKSISNITYTNSSDLWHHNSTVQTYIEDDCDEPWVHLGRESLIIVWKIIYWFTFIMCWAIIPLMQSYVIAAHFHWHQKLIRALIENSILYGVGAVVCLALAIWLIVKENLGTSGLMGVAMAASNAYGLLIVMCLLGYGLTELPRKIWRKSDRDATMRYYQFQAFICLENWEEAKKELDTTLKLIKKYDDTLGQEDPNRKYLRVIIEKCPMQYKDITKGSGEVKTEYKEFVALHSRIIAANNEVHACRCIYEDLLRRAFNLQDVVNSYNSRDKYFLDLTLLMKRKIAWTFKKRKENALTPYLSKLEWYYKVHCEKWGYRLACVLCCIMGICIVWSETLIFVTKVPLSIFYWLIQGPKNPPYVLLWTFTFISIAYVSICAYWTLFRIRIFKIYRLIPHHNSDANSLLFTSYYLARIIAPMVYNFLLMINDKVSAFSEVMGPANLAPLLGNAWNVYFPILLVLFCAANVFDFYSRFLDWFSAAVSCCYRVKVNRFEYDEDFVDDRIDRGKEIINQEREFKLKRNALSMDLGISLLSMKKGQRVDPVNPEKSTKWYSRLFNKKKQTDSMELVEKGKSEV